MSEETEINKRVWRREKQRLQTLATLLNSVNETWDVEAVIDSVDDRLGTFWSVRKEEVHRTMYVFMLAKLRRQVYDLDVQVRGLKSAIEELKKKPSN